MPSTSIRKTDYDPATQTLTVWFVGSGNRYDYANVAPETYRAFRSAFSKGRFFNAFIRNRYEFRLVSEGSRATRTQEPAPDPDVIDHANAEEPTMTGSENKYESGARKYPAKTDADASDQFSQAAAENKKPSRGMGLAQPVDETNEKTRQSDGQNPPKRTSGQAVDKPSGAGPTAAGRSRGAKAPKAGRGAHAKD